mgnify:CR=1 FL=1
MAEIDLQQEMIDRDRGEWEKQLRASAADRGVSYDPSDLEGVVRQVSYGSNAGKDPLEFIKHQQNIYSQRAAPTSHRQYDSQGPAYNQTTQQLNPGYSPAPMQRPAPMQMPAPSVQAPPTASVQSPPTVQSVGAQFSDPLSKAVEQFAQQQAQRLETPPADSGQAQLEAALRALSSRLQAPEANSGQAQLEAALRSFASSQQTPQAGSGQAQLEQQLQQIAQQFQQGGYTPAEMEILQTQAIDPLERLRTARMQQVMLELSKRGIDPQSGVGMSMLADVDRQFDQQRTVLQRDVAGKAADERSSRMLKSLELLSGLAGTQGTRQANAVNAFGQLAGQENTRQAGSVNALGQLAGTENQRRDQAFQYRTVPYNLGQTAFQNARQVANDNDPLRLAGPYAQLAGMQDQRSQFQQNFDQRNQQFQQGMQLDYDRLNAGGGDSFWAGMADVLDSILRRGGGGQ